MPQTTNEQIAELQRDKIIYAVESVAASMIGLIILMAAPLLQLAIPTTPLIIISGIAIAGPIIYWAYTVVGNLQRFNRIKALHQRKSKKA